MTITFVNDLRLSEMATGDNSGTWGNVTNTNLELIGDAFGHGTRAIADASTDNITIADGTADADRAMYLKLTGGGQACTVTLLPNTVSKVWMMENGTSAALTFTQGSGANVIIPAGDTKLIASDGAGSGAVVYDVFASLSVVDLNVSGAVDIDGAVQIDNTVSVGVNDTGYDVKFFGDTASAFMLWDASADDLILGGAAGLSVNSAALVTGVLTTTAAAVFNGGFASNGNSTVDGTFIPSGKITADAGIDIDNFNIDGTTIALSSGNMTIDAADDLILESGDGDFFFKDSSLGANFCNIYENNSDLFILNPINNERVIIQGIDNNAGVNALIFDMADAGTAIFNHDAQFPDGAQVRLGADNDLKLHLSSTTGIVEATNGDLQLSGADDINIIAADNVDIIVQGNESAATFTGNGAVTLFHNNLKKFETTAEGSKSTNQHSSTTLTDMSSNTSFIVSNPTSGNGIYNALEFAGNQQSMFIASINHATEATRKLAFYVGSSGGDAAADEAVHFKSTGAIFNPTANTDKDFQVKSNNHANALFVDGADGKVTISGQLNTSSGVSGIMRTSQRTAISGTTNTTIVTTVGAGGSSAAAAQVIVYGSDNSSRSFMDTLNVGSSSGIVVAQSSTLAGSPHGRTYAISGTNLNLQFQSGASGYAVNCAVTTLDFPH